MNTNQIHLSTNALAVRIMFFLNFTSLHAILLFQEYLDGNTRIKAILQITVVFF